MITPINTNFYGDNVRWFVGQVVDNDDSPTTVQLTRVKIRAVGIHDNIPEDKLPWASVVLPTTEGGNGTGRGAAMDIGAQVFGIFLDGTNSQYPLVLGSIPFARTAWEDLNSYTISAPTEARRTPAERRTDPTFNSDTPETPEAGPPIDPSVAALRTYEFFRTRGYSDAAARGIYGNLYVESINFRPDVIDLSLAGDRDGNARGIAQWRVPRSREYPDIPSRYEELIRFSNERGMAPGTLEAQLSFIIYELDTYSYLGKSGLLQCNTPGEAAVHFMRKFERPVEEGGYSDYPDPAYNGILPLSRRPGNVPKRAGEDQRIKNAENTSFEFTPPTNTETV